MELHENPIGALLLPEIGELIRERRFAALQQALAQLTPPDVADILRALEPHDCAVAFRVLNRALAADVFEYLPPEDQEQILHHLGQAEAVAILNEMAPDDRTALLEDLPGGVTQRLIASLSPEERAIATRLLGYPDESIGRRMTPEYVAVRQDWTIARVLDHLRAVGREKETLNNLYVVDDAGKLIDDIRLRQVVLADPKSTVADLMDHNYVALRVLEDQEEAVRAFRKYDRSSLPVVDTGGALVGIVTVDDVLDVAEIEVTEDMQKMAAVAALEAPYLSVGFFTMFRKRAVWLTILLLGELLTVTVMGHFEQELDKVAVLAFFLPLILSSGGNSGSQAASLIIRALATGDVRLRDWWRVLYRELGSGLSLGFVMGGIGLLALLALRHDEDYVLHLALAVALALISVVVYGTFLGAMMPMLLQRVGFDPAVSSTPFIATLADVTGVIIYFTIATLVLRGSLL